MEFKKMIIVYGHYGSGKTTLSLNLAFDLAKKGPVTLIDLDVVNPYFRSSEYKDALEEKGIRLIAPTAAGTTLDLPSIPADVFSAFDTDSQVIFDVGGDDVGAAALGRFASRIANVPHETLYVINKNRNLTGNPAEAMGILKEIEEKARVKADFIVNNTHMSYSTLAADVVNSLSFAEEVSKQAGLPIKFTSARKEIANEIGEKFENIFPMELIVKPNWE